MRTIDLVELAAALDRFAAAKYGPHARVRDLRSMEGGHAGLTYGLRVCSGEDGLELDSLVLRLAPPGVTRRGNTDVFRQAPLLKALHAAGLPVPDVPWSSSSEEWFGTPFIMMERLPGNSFFIWQPDPSYDLSDEATAPLWQQCVAALAGFHALDWRRDLAGWDEVRPLSEEITRWDKVLEKSPDPACVQIGRGLRDRLLETMPEGGPIGLVHGDYQPGNTLYHQGRLTGIIDWELASIGSQTFDLGWVMMLADQENWHGGWRSVAPISPDDLQAIYEAELGRTVDRVAWYRALAGYRLGAIAGMNVYLHRSGRRPDPVWENFALAAPKLFARADALLEGE